MLCSGNLSGGKDDITERKININYIDSGDAFSAEKMMRALADSQAFVPDDRLTALIARTVEDELDETELDLVSAAAKPEYEKFIKYSREKR